MTAGRREGELPRTARALLRLACPPEDRALILADLDERFQTIRTESGVRRARLWYWGQAARGIPVGFLSRFDPTGPGGHGSSAGGGFGSELRRSIRGLRRRPLYLLGVTGTMAMGLASIATILSIAWNVWLAPLPIPDPDRVVRVFEVEPMDGDAEPEEGRTRTRLSPPLLEDMRARDWNSLSHVAGVARNLFDWQTEQGTRRIRAVTASPEAFEILGLSPDPGRIVRDDPDAREVLLTEPFWSSAFGGDPAVVGGRPMILNGEPHVIVGVVTLPAGYPNAADIVTLLRWSESDLTEGMRGARYLDVIARVRPGRTGADAAHEVDGWIGDIGAVHPNHRGWGGDVAPLAAELIAPHRDVLGMLLAAGVLFLALALSNVAGLVAARSMDARRDRTVRLALGASEAQLLRASAIDGGVVGVLAAIGALGATALLMNPVRLLVPPELPRVELIGLDVGIAAVLSAVAVTAGVAVGALGYLLSRDAAAGIRASTDTSRHSRGRSVIVVGQVALTMLLSTTGVVVLARMAELQQADLGFEPDGILVAPVILGRIAYPTPEARLAFWDDLMGRMEARGVPASFGTSSPMAGVNMPWGYRADPTADQAFAQYHIVRADYFDALGIELIEGRLFEDADRGDTEPVVIVNLRFADENFPGESAIGREIQVVATTRRIVGVVESVRHFGPDRDAPEELYAPYGQDPWPHAQLLIRGEPGPLVSTVAEILEQLDPELAAPPVAPYRRYVADWFAAIHLQAIVVGLLALVGTLLATLGLYALVAWRVSARSREIGIRMALGASDRRMFGDVLVGGSALALTGVAIGYVAWLALSPRIALYVESSSGMSGAPLLVGAVVAVVSLVACGLPAARSVTVDPARTLRREER